jgi:hypothetical protein
MVPQTLLCLAVILAQEPTVPTQFAEVVPSVVVGQPFIRSPEKTRAVVVIQGFTLHLTKTGDFSTKWHSYQKADSSLVKLLSQEADVFALAYGQTLPLTAYADLPVLRQDIQAIRELGYTEIVLVGFSAGGLIARQFVEDVPDCGVTKVIQVDSPNSGTEWAVGSRDAFRHSLTKKARQEFLRERPEKRIPESVQFVSVVGTGLLEGDGVVSIRSQWPEDLQEQGIPARSLPTTHLRAARSQAAVHLIAELVQETLLRWDAMEVAAMRKKLREGSHP